MTSVRSVLLAASFAVGVGAAHAQSVADYPSAPVKMIIPFAPGGATDVVARIFVDQLSARWGGKPIVIENRPGAGTVIGSNAIAKALPDGYTVGMVVGSFMTNAAVNPNLPYDSAKDFTPLGMVAMQPMALVANKNFPVYAAAEAAETHLPIEDILDQFAHRSTDFSLATVTPDVPETHQKVADTFLKLGVLDARTEELARDMTLWH